MVQRKKSPSFGSLFYSSFFSIILLVFLLLMSVSFIKTFGRSQDIKRRINNLEAEISILEGDRTNFLKTIEYLKTDFYKEKEAREKFGLKKPDEKVIVILPEEENQGKKDEENINKWWQLLFK
jgi:hypothetical protein